MNFNEMDDAMLVRACLDGQAAAWRAVVARYQRFVYAIAMRCGLDESAAGDVFQTVFERLHASLPLLLQPERLQAWIGTTAKREALRMRQRARREVALDSEEGSGIDAIESGDPLPEARLQELQQLNLLRGALERLDARCRELLTAIFLDPEEQPSYEAIAKKLGLPIGSLGPTRSRCLQKLRQLMQQI
jgi:RNA polymerase sigma factor (sigma-70 family)